MSQNLGSIFLPSFIVPGDKFSLTLIDVPADGETQPETLFNLAALATQLGIVAQNVGRLTVRPEKLDENSQFFMLKPLRPRIRPRGFDASC